MINTTTRGIFQSDVCIRAAIIKGIEDIRANPYLLDFIFSYMANDHLTQNDPNYGIAAVEDFRNWFMNTEIPVTLSYNINALMVPKIAISLEESSERNQTLGDINKEDPYEDINTIEVVENPQIAIGPFTPIAYDSSIGKITLSDNIQLNGNTIVPDMYIIDTANNQSYQILEVGPDYIVIEEDIEANFTKAVITSIDNLLRVSLESTDYQETYRISLFNPGDHVKLLYLWSIVMFVLLKYKQDYLEARGFENTVINSKGISKWENDDSPEFIYERTIMISGNVSQYWPKNFSRKIDGCVIGLDAMANTDYDPFSDDDETTFGVIGEL